MVRLSRRTMLLGSAAASIMRGLCPSKAPAQNSARQSLPIPTELPISAGGATEILLQFPHAASQDSPYLAHCHILEHEDSGMMAQFTVS